VNKRDFPRVHFYDQDFVDIYDRTWAWVHDFWHSAGDGKQGTEGFFIFCILEDKKTVKNLTALF